MLICFDEKLRLVNWGDFNLGEAASIASGPLEPSISSVMALKRSLKTATENTDGLSNEKGHAMDGIEIPHENDVLMGRGGKNHSSTGNEKLREFARERSEAYRVASKKEKSSISRGIVRLMRELKPPARFLRKDPNTELWEDVGNDIAREKAAQVLRDAVSEKNGPMAKVVSKSTSYDHQQSIVESKEVFGRRNTTTEYQMEHVSHDDIHAARHQAETVVPTHFQPFVTPVNEDMARKRPRTMSETPIPPYPHGNPSPYQHPYVPYMPSPMLEHQTPQFDQSSQQYHPRFPSYSSGGVGYTHIPSYYAPRHAEERVSGRRPIYSPTSQFPQPPEIATSELYNEELLSDHSGHNDGSESPILFPGRRGSL